MTTEQILENMTSRDPEKVLKSVSEILREWQNPDVILPLVPHLLEIERSIQELKNTTQNLAHYEKLVDFAVKTLQFYRDEDGCRCNLYMSLKAFDPKIEKEKDNIIIFHFVKDGDSCIDYYMVGCRKCGQVYKVDEKPNNFTLWDWTKHVISPWDFDYHPFFPSPDKMHRVVYEHVNEVAMGGPLRGYAYLEKTEDNQRILIHKSCGGPPVWHPSGKMVAVTIFSKDLGQTVGVVDLTKMELTIFCAAFRVLHMRSFEGREINLGSYSLDILDDPIDCVVSLVNR